MLLYKVKAIITKVFQVVDQAGFQVTPQLARKHGMAMEVLK